MKKSQLVNIIKEELRGYSKYLGKTKGGTSDEFMQILTKIALGAEPENSADLNKADSGNKDADKVYEGVGSLMTLEGLIEYIQGLQSDTAIKMPRIFPGGFSSDQLVEFSPEEAVVKLTELLDSPKHSSAEFKLTQDMPKFKHISLEISDEEMRRLDKAVRGAGSLD